jgi:TRAP-type C4-dicarboxylate transport system substrate-binding protein
LGAFRLDVDFGAISPITLTVNKDVWAKLPDDVKTAFREAADSWAAETDRRIKAASESGRERCEKEHNLKTTKLSDADRRAWAMAMPNIAQSWAKREDAAKLPGSKMLVAWMDYMREKQQPIVRHWDRE